MKAQFKYAIISGLYVRGPVFIVVFIMNTVFVILGSLGLLPFAAKVTAVSLGGVAIAVMFAANIIGDVAIANRMFSKPTAYLYALTPEPRWKTLFASVITMAVMDIVTMAIVITEEVWLSLILAGDNILNIVLETMKENAPDVLFGFWYVLLLAAGYLLMMMIILFCVTAKKSIFSNAPASGLLAFLLACGCIYAVNLLSLILVPFGIVERFNIFIILTFTSRMVIPFLVLLTLLEAAGLFFITSKLLEKRVNI
ncbi:MAG: hypothetical protein LBI12_02105 [Treponema sp.]|jgi:hypothetical protein|nr:hypothetical protein [Treponema sp.]